MRGAARRLHARRTFRTLSVQKSAATEQVPIRWPTQAGGREGSRCEVPPEGGARGVLLYVERPAEGGSEADGPLSAPGPRPSGTRGVGGGCLLVASGPGRSPPSR